MKRLGTSCKWIRTALAGISVVDRCLILFMLILLAQSAYSLLSPAADDVTGAVNGIDIIVRTSTAGIFGHFLSANFMRSTAGGGTASANHAAFTGETGIQPGQPVQKIGFSTSDEPMEQRGTASQISDVGGNQLSSVTKLQILVAAGIGLFCLIALLLFRNIPALRDFLQRDSATAIVAQFRDFVSGCVGFLIGCPTDASTPKQS